MHTDKITGEYMKKEEVAYLQGRRCRQRGAATLSGALNVNNKGPCKVQARGGRKYTCAEGVASADASSGARAATATYVHAPSSTVSSMAPIPTAVQVELVPMWRHVSLSILCIVSTMAWWNNLQRSGYVQVCCVSKRSWTTIHIAFAHEFSSFTTHEQSLVTTCRLGPSS
jgi:hypothetical protein